MALDVAGPLRSAVLAGLRSALGGGPAGLEEYEGPPGDPGLFGPGSLPWRVHADLPSMLVGGLSSLMLQSLHPLAMAGVADHSRYREDPFGRLQRTARFVAGTTFGSTVFVDQLVGEVRSVHRKVRGIAPDGRRYAADDPHLLTWVHTTETWSFLRSYQRYSLQPLLGAERDRYLAEVAGIGERLGARNVPRSVAQVRRYLAEMRPELAATPEALEVARFLRVAPSGEAPLRAGIHRLVAEAAVDLLPGWARRQLRLQRLAPAPPLQAAAGGLAVLLRWAVGSSLVEQVSTARASAT